LPALQPCLWHAREWVLFLVLGNQAPPSHAHPPRHACPPGHACPPAAPAGLIILKKGGAVQYSYAEKTFGDHAPIEEVLREAQAAGGSA